MRRVERSNIKCPRCGNGMELVAKDMVRRGAFFGESDDVVPDDTRWIPEPEVVPVEMQSPDVVVDSAWRVRPFLAGLLTAAIVTLTLIHQGILRFS